MRFIRKVGDGGYHLKKANENSPTTNEQAESRWESFRKHKPRLKDLLLKEQFGLCAYSEIRPDEHDLETHIEHIRPKSRFPTRTFDYHNMVVNALSNTDLQNLPKKEYFAGHAKGRNYDEARFISPLMEECPRFFRYLSDGRIAPNITLSEEEQRKAEYTIDLLNLNSQFLRNRRSIWLDELDQLIDEYLHDERLSFLADCELGKTNGRLRSFHTATGQRFGSLGKSVIKENYPDLL